MVRRAADPAQPGGPIARLGRRAGGGVEKKKKRRRGWGKRRGSEGAPLCDSAYGEAGLAFVPGGRFTRD